MLEHHRLARYCTVARLITLAVFISIPLLMCLLWLLAGPDFLRSGEARHYLIPVGVAYDTSITELAWSSRLIGLTISLVPNALLMTALWHLAHLFQRFGRGEVFSGRVTQRFRRLAVAMFGYALALPLAGAALSVATSWTNPPGQRLLSISLADSNIGMLLLAACLMVLARVWERGVELADENASFV